MRMLQDYTIIETPPQLTELVDRLAQMPCVAVDTEFVWERTFYARLGLIQLGTMEGACFLIDTVMLPDLSPLGKLLANPDVEKVLHDAPQDLMILRRATSVVPRNIFDSRLAAGFAGLSSEISLQNLLANLLDIQLPKGHTRADWMARPLSVEQLDYAADDVRYLARAAAELKRRACEAQLEPWLNEELTLLDDPSITEERPATESYRRIRGITRLSPRNLAVLRELATWREEEARTTDRPRQHVAEDLELLSVASVPPIRESDFEKCRDLRRRTEQQHGPQLMAAVQRGLALPESERPVPPVTPDERKIGKERIMAASEHIRKTAEARRVDARVVSSKNDILMLLHEGDRATPERHRLLRGWRAELLGDILKTMPDDGKSG